MRAVQHDCPVQAYPFGDPRGLELDPRYEDLRERDPLCRVRLPYGGDAWLVTRHEDVRTVMVDPRFSRAAGLGRDEPRVTEYIQTRGLMDLDPPNLTRLRRLVAGAFTARRVERLRTRALAVATELADRIVAKGSPADLVADFGLPLPVIMICELLGVPAADRTDFELWARAFLSTAEMTQAERDAHTGAAMVYMDELVHQRRAEPTDDLLGALVVARDGHGKLTEEELLFLAAGLLAAGYETTATQIPNFVHTLLTHPKQLALLRERPQLLPSAVEELMRFVPLTATVGIPRWAVADVQLSGGTIQAGDPVYADRNSANRDPRVFRRPDELDITRQPNPHVGFGYGIHHCLGAQLARLELQVALSVLLDRLPDLRFAVPEDELSWRTGHALRGLDALPVEFS
ncbi:cytochrome P450 [Actinocrispum wychmicini]|uniref:Cytochrome P450 n=1 Tax=Actinocrispum wychmicini TaxID=1213861 RepID=A0A4R2JBW2_9PSEU|nr:cytochrome P450 [Actinocrispum wychmicini]TCO53579.1 cytochrome P450 [Actinocrispum wychmicini]